MHSTISTCMLVDNLSMSMSGTKTLPRSSLVPRRSEKLKGLFLNSTSWAGNEAIPSTYMYVTCTECAHNQCAFVGMVDGIHLCSASCGNYL